MYSLNIDGWTLVVPAEGFQSFDLVAEEPELLIRLGDVVVAFGFPQSEDRVELGVSVAFFALVVQFRQNLLTEIERDFEGVVLVSERFKDGHDGTFLVKNEKLTPRLRGACDWSSG